MARGFRFPGSAGGQHDPWFRIGTLEVTTTWFVVLLSGFVLVLGAFSPTLIFYLTLFPEYLQSGQVWRLVTWPLANDIRLGIWPVITIFFFWYFGGMLEEELGRATMARLLLWTTLFVGVLAVVLSIPFGWFDPVVGGLGTLELLVLLIWIAERPHARFLFNIPAWVFGVVIVAIQVLQLTAYRSWLVLLHLLLSIGIGALVARHYGLLQEYAAIPRLGSPGGRPKRQRRTPSSGSGGVVAGPWAGSSVPRVDNDRAQLDALLDKISESGMDSLTSGERKQLEVLRRRIRGE
ncbi:DUF6576 domain-containing protein [Nocardioides sp.]|uniref:DUF6576 domain-containing protein n=1 Tax=Nocardioides sp. TaxID=35761 RepID=UPI003528A2B6